MTHKNSINDILDSLASQARQGETSRIARIAPDLIEEVMNIPGCKKLFATVIPGVTDTVPIFAAYDMMRQAEENKDAILVLVECQATEEVNEALGRLPIRKSSEWRAFSTPESAGV